MRSQQDCWFIALGIAGVLTWGALFAHCAEIPKPKEETKFAAPIIPAELEIRYLRAALESQSAARMADQADAREKAIAKEVQAACGPGFQPKEQMTPDGKSAGRLVCAPVVTEPKK